MWWSCVRVWGRGTVGGGGGKGVVGGAGVMTTGQPSGVLCNPSKKQ